MDNMIDLSAQSIMLLTEYMGGKISELALKQRLLVIASQVEAQQKQKSIVVGLAQSFLQKLIEEFRTQQEIIYNNYNK